MAARRQLPCQWAATPPDWPLASGYARGWVAPAGRARGWPPASCCLYGRSPLGCCPCRWQPLRAGPGNIQSPPFRGPWLQPVAPAAGLAMGGCPCKGPGHGRPPLQGVWPWLATLAGGLASCLLFVVFAVKM
ncbi:hypothetical protein BHM03_00043988 [Ensete ventricosum]|nr:hypothetical protein BHM03_00043988 [Ensete ventricosum]